MAVATGEQALASDILKLKAKELSVPVTFATDLTSSNSYPVGAINAAADIACMYFQVPADFSSITEAVVIRVAVATATHRLNYYSDYGGVGQSYTTHSESLLDQDTAEAAGLIYEEDISGILSSLAASDHVGIKVTGDATNIPNVRVLGLRLTYS